MVAIAMINLCSRLFWRLLLQCLSLQSKSSAVQHRGDLKRFVLTCTYALSPSTAPSRVSALIKRVIMTTYGNRAVNQIT